MKDVEVQDGGFRKPDKCFALSDDQKGALREGVNAEALADLLRHLPRKERAEVLPFFIEGGKGGALLFHDVRLQEMYLEVWQEGMERKAAALEQRTQELLRRGRQSGTNQRRGSGEG